MPDNDDEPPIRLILAALFHAAYLASGKPTALMERGKVIADSVADADELLRQVGAP